MSQGGYSVGDTKLISPFNSESPLIESRPVELADIRDAIDSGSPVLLEVAWFKFDEVTKTWTHDSGHYVGVYGYDYDEMWDENMIQVKVINPETTYGSSRKYADFDTITITRVSPQEGIKYPKNRPYFVSGSHFSGMTMRGFVGMMFRLSPQSQ
jgi:hypothetical protein